MDLEGMSLEEQYFYRFEHVIEPRNGENERVLTEEHVQRLLNEIEK